MVEDTDREVVGFQLGTIGGTILSAPINYSVLIYGIRYALPGAEVGTITAELRAATFGTITGTIDVVTLNTPNNPSIRDSVGERPFYRLEAGQQLVGVIVSPTGATGSLEGALTYAYIPGKVKGA